MNALNLLIILGLVFVIIGGLIMNYVIEAPLNIPLRFGGAIMCFGAILFSMAIGYRLAMKEMKEKSAKKGGEKG
jgi:hypothetical protein